MAKSSPFLAYIDDFSEGLRTDVPAYKAPVGSLVKAENCRLIPKGGFHSRKGYPEVEAWVFGTGLGVTKMRKMLEHNCMFFQSGTKIFVTVSEDDPVYSIGLTLQSGKRGDFKEYNSEMKFSNGYNNYQNITVGRVLTEFTDASASIVLEPGNTDLFRKPKTGEFTADASTDVISATAHGLSNGDHVAFWSSGTLPAGLSAGVEYFVRHVQTDSFKVSLTWEGDVVDITDTGSGTHNFTDGILYCKGNLITYTKKKSQNFTAEADDDTITSAAHNLSNGDIIQVSNSGGALPTGLSASTNYYVIEATTNTFKLSASLNGAAIDISTDGTGTQTFDAVSGGDTFGGTLRIPSGTYEVGNVVTQTEDVIEAPKARIIESVFEKMMGSAALKAGHAIYYSRTANVDTPEYIDDFVGSGADVELFGKFGRVTAMQTLREKMYVAKQKGIEIWSTIDENGIPVRALFTDAYGIVNDDCLVQMGDKLVFLTDTNRIKTIEPDNTAASPEPVINPNFDLRIKGTLALLDLNQDAARMGYNERDDLMRCTAVFDGVKSTLIFHTDAGGWTQDTNINAGCWEEWNGVMYVGDASSAKVYKAETGFQDGSVNPKMDVFTSVIPVGAFIYRRPVRGAFLKGLIRTGTTMTVSFYADGVLHKSVDIESTGEYVSTSVVRPFGRDSFGVDPFGLSGGDDESDSGFEFAVPIDLNVECSTIQVRFEMQGEGYRVEVDVLGILDDVDEATPWLEDAI